MSNPRVNVMASTSTSTIRFTRASTWMWFVAGPSDMAGAWASSLLAPRHGWATGYPGPSNLIGLIPVAIGTIGLIWGVALHLAHSPEGIKMELAQSYLLTRGPYVFSRHPGSLHTDAPVWVGHLLRERRCLHRIRGWVCLLQFCRQEGRAVQI